MNRPNIILIITDHFRQEAIGRFTPNLKKLAAAGVEFRHAYCAAPLCQPARVSLVTGKFPSQHGVCGNQNPPVRDDLRNNTFMHNLQQAGYYTAMIGKHHFIDRYGLGMDVREDDEAVKAYGFDHVCQVADDGENQHNGDEYTAWLESKGLLEDFRGRFQQGVQKGRHPYKADDTADGFIARQNLAFIRDYSQKSPFYLNWGFIGPHPPFWFPGEPVINPEELEGPVGADDSAQIRQRKANYYEKCRLIDHYMGELAVLLTGKGIAENTVIIFTSDHGENLGNFGIWDKRFFYEDSCGVPLIISGPGIRGGERMNGPRISKALVSHLDLYPTILEAAGIMEPPVHHRWGRSLIPMINNVPGSLHDAVYAELSTSVMIRTAGWKLVFDPEQGGVRDLYNLHNDPREENNLAGVAGYELITNRLVQRLLSHRILLTQFSHAKEEQRLQSVRAG